MTGSISDDDAEDPDGYFQFTSMLSGGDADKQKKLREFISPSVYAALAASAERMVAWIDEDPMGEYLDFPGWYPQVAAEGYGAPVLSLSDEPHSYDLFHNGALSSRDDLYAALDHAETAILRFCERIALDRLSRSDHNLKEALECHASGYFKACSALSASLLDGAVRAWADGLIVEELRETQKNGKEVRATYVGRADFLNRHRVRRLHDHPLGFTRVCVVLSLAYFFRPNAEGDPEFHRHSLAHGLADTWNQVGRMGSLRMLWLAAACLQHSDHSWREWSETLLLPEEKSPSLRLDGHK